MSLAEAVEDLPAPVRRKAEETARPAWFEWLAAPFARLNLQWQAGMAVALLSVGFLSGTYLAARRNAVPADSLDTGLASVQSINSRPDGGLDIALDTTHRQTVHGSLDDPRIRALLLSALGQGDSGVRLDSVEQLKDRAMAGDPQVRAALIASLRTDKNPGVRLKALDALKGVESDPAVRQVLLNVLVSDANPGVRIKAIEMLSGQSQPDSAAIATLQKLAEGDSSSAIRLKSTDTLRKWNAPVELY